MARSPFCLLIKNIPTAEWSTTIDEKHQVIGRAADADIVIPPRFTNVSRRHAEVWVDRYGVWIQDLGSRLGTMVNGVSIQHLPQASIAFGDTISLADIELIMTTHVATSVKPKSTPYDPDETPIAPVKQTLTEAGHIN